MYNQKSIDLIKDFVDEYLHGDINELWLFDFKQLKGNRKYGSCNGSSFDSDNTRLTRAILVVTFNGAWPNFDEESMRLATYRGDTINSFHTLFGGTLNDGNFEGTNKFKVDIHLRKQVKRFYHLYSTIGNFVPLPNRMVNRQSFNTYRGTCAWHDYFDKFLSALQQYCINGTASSETFAKLIESNKDALKNCSSRENFLKVGSALFLEDFFDADGLVKSLFEDVYWWKKGLTTEEYVKTASTYLDFCEPFIVNRSKRMIQVLKNCL